MYFSAPKGKYKLIGAIYFTDGTSQTLTREFGEDEILTIDRIELVAENNSINQEFELNIEFADDITEKHLDS